MANVTQKLISEHLESGNMEPGSEVGIRIDQTLTQDATGTLVMLELEAMGLDRVHTELSAQYVDHNLVQEDSRNPDDHLFLESACRRFGVWFSRPGNGVSHPLHMERFGCPGATMLGSDSHTPAAGSLGMLAIGAGGLEVALAMAGETFHMPMPEVWGVELVGQLPDWVSAKDVILEMLRRHGVRGGMGRIIEYHGPGLEHLSAMDRHVIANMGAELGATTTVFPADRTVREFLESQQRPEAFRELIADEDATYDVTERIDLTEVVPLIARPSSPGDVVTVEEEAGADVYQTYIGSSANPGYRDFAIAAEIVDGQQAHDGVSFDINPTSRQVLENLMAEGELAKLIHAGARLHQAGCNGCIGMGQAPATDRISLRTVPRNFPGRSGTKEDKVYLVSPETAAASALKGVITDPRTLSGPYPQVHEPEHPIINAGMLMEPPPADEAASVELVKGPNIVSLPHFDALPDHLALPVLLNLGDDVSTDEIMPAGAKVLPYRSNIPEISRFVFRPLDPTYPDRALEVRDSGDGHAVVAGSNYGQGSSREHAALAPRFLGLRVVMAASISRIHRQNLPNFGVVPLQLKEPDDAGAMRRDEVVTFDDLTEQLRAGPEVVATLADGTRIEFIHDLSERELDNVIAGGAINRVASEMAY